MQRSELHKECNPFLASVRKYLFDNANFFMGLKSCSFTNLLNETINEVRVRAAFNRWF